ncbi:serine hydrolase [Oleiphilus sp. HI0071]|jgi:CubicO group peptidase (beta-lactamase class C family)|uniref:serine hydrolase domain-containing protein n=1 Tax=unclassified Oleiphilus TaxID=2631174 RepID=UPI0007C38548|nr:MULTISPECIES: serine hydrolase domain-containing protein [unclassified Oleiphilus]KZY62372.1 serine hydrolase [Oleiphilus sp. HI0065]KZY78739.1 serine hydrolase [Oleiphilus sp. HI0071]KZY99764.1 serine hydrolase [Oleiphilus sp. HI0073]KZZ48734.1 serine hydrolase [Oleiphilus sp. HI0122]KZZ49914.1 serine hydrolase [Oleiphilus sp. HI0118]KZZ72169.1 serine hydrolase [Oleiphilus sp. HI0130]KZZ78567.1 serine hydrolase [Oleiphilus sp. HI0133]
MLLDASFSGLNYSRIKANLGNTIVVPESLAQVTTIEKAQEVDPESVEMTQRDVREIWEAVEGVYRTGTHPAISLCVRRKGEIVLHRAIGHASGNGPSDDASESKVLMRPETPICFFSASKAVTALLIHMLNEQKLINLHDPISFYVPEFAKNGKKNITIHQVLSHRSGIPGLPEGLPVETLWDNDTIWRLLCDAEPSSPRGDKLAYHALTGGYILERVVNKVTGDSIQALLDKRIRKPMGMKYFQYGIDPKYSDRVATNYATGIKPMFPVSYLIKRALGGPLDQVQQVTNDPRFMQAVIPAGNIMGTAEEMNRFFQMMSNGGTWKGKQVAKDITIRRAVQEVASVQFDRTLMLPMRYSAGLMLGGRPVGVWGLNSSASYGHIGLINKMAWVDPKRELTVSLMTSGIPIVANNIPSLVRFVNTISKNCSVTSA